MDTNSEQNETVTSAVLPATMPMLHEVCN